MVIRRLAITDVRNIRQAHLEGLTPVTILYGQNGSGKTSVLEAIHILSSARSFRSHKLSPVIFREAEQCVVFGEVCRSASGNYLSMGVQRSRSSGGQIKVAGRVVNNTSELAECLPLQVINSDSFSLLEGSPSVRRRFLDWGVFHVEHDFHQAWKQAQRCLKQRNSLLRSGRMADAELVVWTDEFIRSSELLDSYRQRYLQGFKPIFERCLSRLLDLEGLKLSYHRGWDSSRSLREVLASQAVREREHQHTTSGPHRADLRLRYHSHPAHEVLSRGQQKLVVCALSLAQGYYLSQLKGHHCVYLVDDLPAELDAVHRKALCALLYELECQVFISCVDYRDVDDCWPDKEQIRMFHVEHGQVTALDSAE
jgi:DNA replication and repair protein RecF